VGNLGFSAIPLQPTASTVATNANRPQTAVTMTVAQLFFFVICVHEACSVSVGQKICRLNARDPKRSRLRQSVECVSLFVRSTAQPIVWRPWLRQTKRCGIMSNDIPRVIVSEVVQVSRRSRFSVGGPSFRFATA